MKKVLFLLALSVFFLSCRENKEKPSVDDLVKVNENGIQENKVDQLSVEDVERLMKNSDNPSQSYTAILTNDIEKSYFVTSDTNQTVRFSINAKSENIELNVYKEMIKSVQVDSANRIKIKDFVKVSDSSNFSVYAKKTTKYKAVVKLKRKFESKDSTADFTLNIFKD